MRDGTSGGIPKDNDEVRSLTKTIRGVKLEAHV